MTRRHSIAAPPLLRRLLRVEESELWLVKKAVRGLRAAPKAWEEARDKKLNHAILNPEEGHAVGQLQLVPWNITAGLWRIVRCSDPDTIVGVLAMYVDDGLVAGLDEVVQHVGTLILLAWNTEMQAVLANAGFNLHAGSNFAIADKQVSVVQEAAFLGIRIRRLQGGSLFLTQEACGLGEG